MLFKFKCNPKFKKGSERIAGIEFKKGLQIDCKP